MTETKEQFYPRQDGLIENRILKAIQEGYKLGLTPMTSVDEDILVGRMTELISIVLREEINELAGLLKDELGFVVDDQAVMKINQWIDEDSSQSVG